MDRAIVMICDMQYVVGRANAICDANTLWVARMQYANTLWAAWMWYANTLWAARKRYAIYEYAMGRANIRYTNRLRAMSNCKVAFCHHTEPRASLEQAYHNVAMTTDGVTTYKLLCPCHNFNILHVGYSMPYTGLPCSKAMWEGRKNFPSLIWPRNNTNSGLVDWKVECNVSLTAVRNTDICYLNLYYSSLTIHWSLGNTCTTTTSFWKALFLLLMLGR